METRDELLEKLRREYGGRDPLTMSPRERLEALDGEALRLYAANLHAEIMSADEPQLPISPKRGIWTLAGAFLRQIGEVRFPLRVGKTNEK